MENIAQENDLKLRAERLNEKIKKALAEERMVLIAVPFIGNDGKIYARLQIVAEESLPSNNIKSDDTKVDEEPKLVSE